ANAEIAGLLALVHPSARFIDMDRDARDTALSIFMHEFPHGFAYSNNLEEIRSYLAFRRTAVEKWIEAGLDVVQLKYEDFVTQPVEAGKTLFGHLDLQWKDELLKPEFRKSPVRTFSANAVREPVQNKRVGRWQNYSKYFNSFEP
ncbi:MAG: sulfotransferase, partial [Hyphomonadaceae bacterium]